MSTPKTLEMLSAVGLVKTTKFWILDAAGGGAPVGVPAAAVKVSNNERRSEKEENSTSPFDRWTVRDPSTMDFGFFAGTASKGSVGDVNYARGVTDESRGAHGFYITTAINYTNGPPHMGHAYEATTADAIARYARLVPSFTGSSEGEAGAPRFVTGTDEHGQKIANRAGEEGVEPIELCNKYASGFQALNQRILMSNDDYVRTTSDRHKRTARALWERCAAAGDIYLDAYSGWYNIREETFVSDNDAALSEFKDPVSGVPLKRVEEESYFFRMSKYHERLMHYIETENPDFIRPSHHKNLILTRLKSDPLRDLSISRTSFSWGVPVPKSFNENHVMYVWVDALSNYLTGVDGLGANGEIDEATIDPKSPWAQSFHWPADVHIIGKDILWFHTVIWPCLLMSAGLPLPRTVFAHGFVNDKEGKKMSKSLGNVIDPHEMLDLFPVDSFRLYLCKEAPYGGELAFSEDSLRDMHNADLCDTFGNLVNRATNLCHKYCDGVVPDVPPPESSPINFASYRERYISKMSSFEIDGGASLAIAGFRELNGYLTEQAPWLLKGDENSQTRRIVVRATLEAIYALTHFLTPFTPVGAAATFRKLNKDPLELSALDAGLRNLATGAAIDIGDVLYAKLVSEEERLNSEEAAKKKALAYAEAQQRKKEKKAQDSAASKKGQAGGGETDQPEFTKMDIRVGRITKVWHHPDADKLFCEEIDVGEGNGPRSIASGLRDHYVLEQMHDRMVLVVCNLKAAKLAGFSSEGMVLAAKSEDGSKVELVSPPEGSVVGERVYIDGLSGEPLSSAQTKKKKTWDAVAKGLKTGDGAVATWEGKEILTKAGPCKAETLEGAPIS